LVECTLTVKFHQLRTEIFLYLEVSTSNGSLHQKNENVISSSGSWHRSSNEVADVPRKQLYV